MQLESTRQGLTSSAAELCLARDGTNYLNSRATTIVTLGLIQFVKTRVANLGLPNSLINHTTSLRLQT